MKRRAVAWPDVGVDVGWVGSLHGGYSNSATENGANSHRGGRKSGGEHIVAQTRKALTAAYLGEISSAVIYRNRFSPVSAEAEVSAH